MPVSSRISAGVVAAWAIPIACLVAVVAGILLTTAAGASETGYLVVDAVVGATYPAVGALIIARRPRNPVGWLFAAAGAGLSAQALAGGLAVASPGTPLGAVAAWTMNWVFFAGLGPLLLLPLLLPDGRLPSPRWRPVLVVLGSAVAALTVLLMFRDRLWVWGEEFPNPIGFAPTDTLVAPAFAVVVVAVAVSGVAALAARVRTGGAEVRRRLLPILAAAVVIAAAVIADVWLPPEPPVGIWLFAITLPLLPAATAVSVFRYRLFDVELGVRRTVVYALVTGILLLAYLAVVAAAHTLLGASGGVVVPLVGTAVVAVAFAPLRDLVQRTVARFLFGDRGDPDAALSQLGERLELAGEAGTPLHDSAETVAVTLRLPAVVVADADGRPVSSFGETTDATGAAVPLRAGGRLEGTLAVATRSPGEALTRTDLAVLEELARPLALALAASRLAREVQASRERLAIAREDERRRLRRELHDGLGPGLAAIGVQLDLAEAAPADRAPAAIGRARGLTEDLVREVRRIVHDLRPAALDELGLLGAVEDLALAAGGPAATTPVEVVPPRDPLPGLSAATEVAAYRIVQEALANALRHADATRVRVRVEADDGVLRVAVEDDGRGVPPDAAEGVGSGSMRDRAAELGGVLRREDRSDGGTIVTAELPW